MDDDFERYTPDTRGLNIADLNRIIDRVGRGMSASAASVPSVDTPAGKTPLRRPDVFSMMLIQVSAVFTDTTLFGSANPVYLYDWTEVVRSGFAYATPGDGRSGTAYLGDGSLNFPAIDIRPGSVGGVPLNIGSTTSAYMAWLSWDERCLEFIGASDFTVACVAGNIVVTKG